MCCDRSAVSIASEAYRCFKADRQDETKGEAAAAQSDVASAAAATAAARSFLQYAILSSLLHCADRFNAHARLNRLPLYSLLKLGLTLAVCWPNPAFRSWLYSHVQPYLVHADTLFQLHWARVLRRSSFGLHRSLLSSARWLLQCSAYSLADSQLEVLNQQTLQLALLLKQEKTKRLLESVSRLPIMPASESEDDEERAHGRGAAATAERMVIEEECEEELPLSPRRACVEEEDVAVDAAVASGENEPSNLRAAAAATAATVVSGKGAPSAALSTPKRSPKRHARQPTATSGVLSLLSPSAAAATASSSSASSSLSHRLAVLGEHGNESAMLLERTAHTPQKAKLWSEVADREAHGGDLDGLTSPQRRKMRQTMV